MKKILTILAAAAAIFGAASCSTGTMHDAEVMLVEKVVVEGLTELVGQEMVISGNWILGKDGTSTWVHGEGDSSKIADGAIGTVGADGTVEFEVNLLTSESTLEFLGKVNEAGWVNAKRFGEKAYAEGNAKVPNAFTGSATPKTLLGRVQSDKTITWSFVDKIIPLPESTFINITAVNFVNVPASFEGQKIGLVEGWIPGNDWTNYQAGMTGVVTSGAVTFTFATPVKITSDSIGIQSTVVTGTAGIDWGNKVIPNTLTVPVAFDDESHTVTVDFASITGKVN